jgi:hypothetical protein
MSRLSHSQHEIQGILQCSEPESEGHLSDSADELGDPGDVAPPAGPEPELRQLADQADIEDMGALAQDIRDADMQEQDHQQQQPAGKHMQLCLSHHGIFAPCRSHFARVSIACSGCKHALQTQWKPGIVRDHLDV